MKYIYLQLIISYYFMSKCSMYTEGGNVITDRACTLAKSISERLVYFHGFWIKQNKATIVAQSKQRVKEFVVIHTFSLF